MMNIERDAPAPAGTRAPPEGTWNATVLALGIMTVSQFLDYVAPHTERHTIELMGVYTPTATSGFGVEQAVPGESGWSAHPYAWLMLGALLALFVLRVDLGDGWRRWRTWIAVAGMTLCLFPFDVEHLPGWGFLLGLVAIAIGIFAARQASPAVGK